MPARNEGAALSPRRPFRAADGNSMHERSILFIASVIIVAFLRYVERILRSALTKRSELEIT